jgi:16S rRNA (guanine966-N2)-methyltransferase
LVVSEGATTRPTSDRTREAVFNALWSRGVIEGAHVVDLFAGSGAMGIEALSRGAAHAVFVETDRQARRAIEANLSTCGFEDLAEVSAGPAERLVDQAAQAGRSFDLAFCDPPYAYDGWPELLARVPAAFVVIESAAPVDLPERGELVREARYGAAWVAFVELVRAGR